MKIRWMKPEELLWVNQTYKAIDFVPSVLNKDRVAIACIEDEKAGIGRLVPLKEGGFELGGIYVIERFRNLGIAREIVSFLLDDSSEGPIYCLPFVNLKNFYSSFGFENCFALPEEIAQKHAWCLKTYPQNVLAMAKLCPKSST